MPSPSRIPRGKGLLKAKQPEENNPQVSDIAQTADGKCDSADQKKIRTQSKAALYGSKVKNTSKVHHYQQHAALRKQGILHDRRGISEVKRSETHLQSKVNQLEAEMADIKQDLVKAQERYDQDQMKYITLQKHADALDCKLNNLQLYNDRLHEALEENNIDPVTLENLQFPTSFDKEMESSKHKGVTEADGILFRVQQLDALCETMTDKLNQLVFGGD